MTVNTTVVRKREIITPDTHSLYSIKFRHPLCPTFFCSISQRAGLKRGDDNDDNDTNDNYIGGNFRCRLVFPPSYPLLPPTLTFQSPIPFHPNIYPSGLLCISILHPPEDDKYGYESASERWSPVQTPETILLSVISLLHSPNDESPANVEAARLLREDVKEFRRRCRKGVRESLGED